MIDVEAIREALNPQKRTSITSRHEFIYFIYIFYFIFGGHFCPLGLGSSRPKAMRIRIHNTAYDALPAGELNNPLWI
jgi:hypothetical protein